MASTKVSFTHTLTNGTTADAGDVQDNFNDIKDFCEKIDEDDMASNSATAMPTQQSVKAYVDTSITSVAGLDFEESLSAGEYAGITCQGVYGDTLVFGDLIYLNDDDTRWELADADAEVSAGPVILGIALESGGDGDSRLVLLKGFVCLAAWNWNVGDALFVHTTAGDMTQTAPSGAADIIRIVGWAHDDADTIYFSPSADYFEHN